MWRRSCHEGTKFTKLHKESFVDLCVFVSSCRDSAQHAIALSNLLTLRTCSFILSHRLIEKQLEPADARARRKLRQTEKFMKYMHNKFTVAVITGTLKPWDRLERAGAAMCAPALRQIDQSTRNGP